MAYSEKRIEVPITREERDLCEWLMVRLDGYFENLRDGQECCTQCGIDDYCHKTDPQFDEAKSRRLIDGIIEDHDFVDEWPELAVDISSDTMFVRTDPKLVYDYIVYQILDSDFQDADEADFAQHHVKKPSMDVALGLRKKVVEYFEGVKR